MNSIYKQLDKIDDSKSLNENWNVKNQRELKKLIRESIEGADEAIELAREYILDQYSYNDYDFEETNTEFLLTLWCGDFEDESEVTYKMSIEKLVELKDDETAFEEYIDSCENFVDYEAAGDEFYRRAEEELNKHFNCTGAFLEPSTQLGQGRTFLFADDMRFDGSFDFQTGEDYIRENNFEGFLELCKDSFTVVTDESLTEDAETSTAVMKGIDKIIKDTTEILEEASPIMESGFVEYFDKYKHYVETQDIDKVKNSLDEFIKYINIKFIDRINFFKNQL